MGMGLGGRYDGVGGNGRGIGGMGGRRVDERGREVRDWDEDEDGGQLGWGVE